MAELYNEGLFRKGLVRTSGLVRPDLLLTFDDIFSPYAIDRLEAALALDFNNNVYRTGNTSTTFADAFTGTSPKLTYSTAAGSNSTMVNSAGNIVWAPHNLIRYSEDLSGSYWTSTNLVDPVQQSDTVLTPDGSGYAYYLEDDATNAAHHIRDTFGPLANATWTATAYIKQKDAGMYVQLRPYGVGSGLAYATFSAADGTLYESGGTELVSAANGVSVGDGWFKVSITCSASLPDSNDGLNIVLSDGTSGENPNYIGSGNGVYIWGAHVYRSDLGGMHPVPQSATGFQYYVPTNGNAEYLPRVGHHVYNGSAWVNEGLLIESEPRSNYVTSITSGTGSTATPDSGVSPSGVSDAVRLSKDATDPRYAVLTTLHTVAANTTYTASAYFKWDGHDMTTSLEFNSNAHFDVSWRADFSVTASGISVSSASSATALVEDVGNGWHRCSATFTSGASPTGVNPNAALIQLTGGDGASLLAYGAQLEAGSTPSSYMPTSGGTYTRTAQSLTVPPAEFGWPEPEYIGSELLSAFSDASWVNDTEWTYDATNDEWNLAASEATVSGLQHDISVTEGSVYVATATVSNITNVSGNEMLLRVLNTEAGTVHLFKNDGSGAAIAQGGDGTYTVTFVAGVDTPTFSIRTGGAVIGDETATLVSASVREINPLSVSIQMDGRMTYADEDVSAQHMFHRWQADGDNRLNTYLDTSTTRTGSVYFYREANSVGLSSFKTSATTYSPGVLVPFNFAVRHGSNFINGAVDGVALTEDTTPTALPDLSSTNIKIAYDYMGTIGTFRQFAGDIGDTGLVTATNPSTEPTLSLTFDGTNGSFYNLSWSE